MKENVTKKKRRIQLQLHSCDRKMRFWVELSRKIRLSSPVERRIAIQRLPARVGDIRAIIKDDLPLFPSSSPVAFDKISIYQCRLKKIFADERDPL